MILPPLDHTRGDRTQKAANCRDFFRISGKSTEGRTYANTRKESYMMGKSIAELRDMLRGGARTRSDVIDTMKMRSERYISIDKSLNAATDKLYDINPDLLNEIEEASMQQVLFESDIEYATGLFDGALLYHLFMNVFPDDKEDKVNVVGLG